MALLMYTCEMFSKSAAFSRSDIRSCIFSMTEIYTKSFEVLFLEGVEEVLMQ